MTSQVYYRKWRPGTFSDLVGQEHVATTLREAIKQGRVSHSFLFCGPRGTGKTTTARVLAKAVNCLDPQEGDPCNACAICRSVNEGRFMDIIELDAASNRGIDEIREIRDKVHFAPVEGKRKVYIIDEAHMLTDQASNAFLKTLEEPPAHVIFVLCTTEAHKILATIISRCQRFDFRRLPAEVVCQRMADMAATEGVAVELEALRLVARYAAGSMRDALNLLEQLVVSYGNSITLRQVEELLGLGHSEKWLDLARYLVMGNTAASLGIINQAAWEGTDLRQLHRQTLELLRAIMLLQWDSGESLDLPEHITGQLRQLIGGIPAGRIVKAVKIWGEVNMRYDSPSTLPLELSVVEICNDDVSPVRAVDNPTPSRLSYPATNTGPGPASGRTNPQRATPSQSSGGSASPEARPQQPARNSNPVPPGHSVAPNPSPAAGSPTTPVASGNESVPASSGDLLSSWQTAVKALGRYKGKKYNLGALLRDCKSDAIVIDGDTMILPFNHRANMERMQEEIEDPRGRQLVTEAVKKFLGVSYQFRLTLVGDNGNPAASGATPNRQNQHSPLVRAALGMGARILEEVQE